MYPHSLHTPKPNLWASMSSFSLATLHPQRVIGSLGSLEVSRSLQPDAGAHFGGTSGSEYLGMFESMLGPPICNSHIRKLSVMCSPLSPSEGQDFSSKEQARKGSPSSSSVRRTLNLPRTEGGNTRHGIRSSPASSLPWWG